MKRLLESGQKEDEVSNQPICLLERSAAGEGEAAGLIQSLYTPITYRWCRRWGIPRKDAPRAVRKGLRSAIDVLKKTGGQPGDQEFRSMLWSRSRYIASDHPKVVSMNIPENYPADVQDSIVIDDTGRLLRTAGELLVDRFPEDQKCVFEQLLKRQRSPVEASQHIRFSVPEIRKIRNVMLRRLYAEFGPAIGLIGN